MKNFNDQDLQQAVESILATQKGVTTLEIKKHLQHSNLWAVQWKVSSKMNELYETFNLDFTTNGSYRTYFLKNSNTPQSNDSSSSVILDFEYVQRNLNKVKTKEEHEIEKGDWIVTDTSKLFIAYFDSMYTRDQVRQAFSNATSCHFHNTRTSHVK
jgi:arginine repressor